MLLTLKVETTDETYEVSTNLFVVVQWERRFKRKASDMATGVGRGPRLFGLGKRQGRKNCGSRRI